MMNQRRRALLVVSFCCLAITSSAENLRVMTIGLGTGTVTGAGISCSTTGGMCDTTFSTPLELTATDGPGSHFVQWVGDCSGATCMVPIGSDRSVRAQFDLDVVIPEITDFTATGINTYLMMNSDVNTPARFLKALPQAYRQNWILMSRSESLQPGTAALPRFLLPSADARYTFTFGLRTHDSYPAAAPNAIEYMQWEESEKTFRFHEIVLAHIDPMMNHPPLPPAPLPPRTPRVIVDARDRGVSIDDKRCFQCHSTRNVLSRTGLPGTTGVPPGVVPWKNKPNWDAYDSWGGMLPFNRDRIFKGSVEAAAFRKLFNPWTWRNEPEIRAFIEQLELQPSTISVPTDDVITQIVGGPNDGHVAFAFDGAGTPPPIVLNEPAIFETSTSDIAYSFDGVAGTSTSTVYRGGSSVLLHDSVAVDDEGRGVEYFDRLGGADGNLNPRRIADEINRHSHATGSVPIDVRPVAYAITNECLTIATLPSLTSVDLTFFESRHGGMTITDLVADLTRDLTTMPENRTESLPRRKADIQKRNLDRTGDPYLVAPENGLIQQYGATTDGGATPTPARLRQEVFRRALPPFNGDSTVMGQFFVDREKYNQNTEKMALFRFFLEPLGVSVDKWSMSVRGRSRTYTFADIFEDFSTSYLPTFRTEIGSSLTTRPAAGLPPAMLDDCTTLLAAVTTSLGALPPANDVPKYSDIQRIFNKGCIECHGGLSYPPFDVIFDADYLDLSEDEVSTVSRLARSLAKVNMYTTFDPATSYLYQRITEGGEKCPESGASPAPLMPCGGPPLSQADIQTIARWIRADPHPGTVGDPHIRTVDGTEYDFQGAGEFVLLRGEDLEIQARQTPVTTTGPLPNAHTGLSACVSINTAVAFRVGTHRISYEPNLNGRPDPSGLELRVDGKLTTLGDGVVLSRGGRILPTTAPGGIQIEYPGGTDIIVTPGFWNSQQLWHLDLDVRHARATDGIMGSIARLNWLPALPDGTFLGPKPGDPAQRYHDLYGTFANAWRVNNQTTLFDYAPGRSTATYTLAAWPGIGVQTCSVPPSYAGAPPMQAAQPLPLAVAQQHCAPIVDLARRKNCVQDVMVTGEPGFAKTYLLGEAILRNARPTAPALLFPARNQHDLASTVSFTWNKTKDANGDRITYLQCVWPTNGTLTFNQCKELPRHLTMLDGYDRNLLLLFLAILLVLLILLFARYKRLRLLAVLFVLIVLLLVFFVLRFADKPTLAREVEGLKPGQAYFWKVIAQDGKGGTIESETRRFAIKPK